MEESLKAKEELIVKDTALIQRLSDEACEMFDVLISRLEQYNAARDSSGSILAAIHASTLQGIPSCVARLGVPNGERLNPFLISPIGNGVTHQKLPTGAAQPPITKPAATVAPIGAPILTGATAQTTTKPKFSWASTSNTKPKASLLEIQKEELSKASS